MVSYSRDLAGKTLGHGRYRLARCLKSSRLSMVYKGIDVLLRRSVAVKVLNNELDSTFLLRFKREARIMAHFDHANIAPIFDYGEQAGLLYLVMPYLPDGSLQDMLDQQGPFSLQETCEYIQQAADALDYAHVCGVIHRDLKLSNFLLHPDGRLLLADFGIARVMYDDERTTWHTLTGQQTLIGTSGYIAPEIIRGKPLDLRADIYALGIVLFQMLSGDMPFKGDTYPVLIQQLQGTLPLLHQLDQAIPAAVDTVIQKATHQQPEERFASAGELAQALWQAASSQTVPTPFSTGIEPLLQAAMPQPMKRLSSYQNGSVAVEEQLTPAAVPHTPLTLRVHDTLPISPHGRPGVRHLPFITMFSVGFIICGLLLPFALKLLPDETSHTVPVPISRITPTPVSSPAQQAANAVRHYYNTWNSREYRGAYSQLEPAYQQMHPYSTLYNSYVNTLHSSVTVESTTQLANGTFKVTVTDVAVEKSSSGHQTVNRVYHGYFLVKQENGNWKLTPYFTFGATSQP